MFTVNRLIFAYDFAYDKRMFHHDAAHLLTMHFPGNIHLERERGGGGEEKGRERDDNLYLKI